MSAPEKQIIKEPSDTLGAPKTNITQHVDKVDTNPRITKGDKAIGDAGVETPWRNSHQITKPGGSPVWQAQSYNSQGRDGQTDWQHKGAERGDTEGPQQRVNPWAGLNNNETNKIEHVY